MSYCQGSRSTVGAVRVACTEYCPGVVASSKLVRTCTAKNTQACISAPLISLAGHRMLDCGIYLHSTQVAAAVPTQFLAVTSCCRVAGGRERSKKCASERF